MAKRGRKPMPKDMHVLRGTFQAYRSRASVVAAIDREPVPPPWLQGEALALWHAQFAT
jgi:hypothetical protein